MIVATCMFTKCGFQQACQWILTAACLQIQLVQTKLSSIVLDAQLYTLASSGADPGGGGGLGV